MELNSRSPEYFTDNNGQRCVTVRLANTTLTAALHADDLERLLQAGLSHNWSLHFNKRGGNGYVSAKVPGDNSRLVARLISGAGAGQQVAYRDGNRLNLRGNNLLVTTGGTARVDCAALLESCATVGALAT